MASHRMLAIDHQAAANGGQTRLLTAREVARRLGVSTETVLRWTRFGSLPGFRMPGGALRYDELELDDWLADRATSETDPEIADGLAAGERTLGSASSFSKGGR